MSNPSALIIEDDNLLADIFSRTLNHIEYDTTVISNGRIALNQLENTVPDLVVLDLHLPDISGDQILEYVSGNSRFDQTRIIIASADAVLASQLKGRITLTLIKPIDPVQLQQLANRLRPNS